ncbi:MAG: hypothetical protein VW405_20700 [Rhodospirillaceae bacterium]|jgi:regulator of RNase E activity RraB
MRVAALQSDARVRLIAQIVDCDREINRLDGRRIALAAADHRYEATTPRERKRRRDHAKVCVDIIATRTARAHLLDTLRSTP